MVKILSVFLISFSFLCTAEEDSKKTEMIPTEVLILETAAKAPKKGGGSSSIGTDSYDLRIQTGWFYGNKPIATCYNALSNFGVSNKELEGLIKSSIRLWQNYFKEKVVVAKGGKENLKPNLNFKFKGKCTGDEDLVLFFGAGPIFGNIQDLKSAQTLQAPLAYANKTQMRRDMEWSKGYIRFANHGEYASEPEAYPNWKKPDALKAVIIHELGHILGLAHTPHTIMRAELMEQIFQENKEAIDLAIDQDKQLITCENCKEVYALDKKTSNPILMEQFGLNAEKPIQLIKQGSDLTLTDGKLKVKVEEVKLSRVEKVQTLFTNFSSALNNISRTANIYGVIPGPKNSKRTPVVIEYNSMDHRGGMALRALSGESLQDPVVFKR